MMSTMFINTVTVFCKVHIDFDDVFEPRVLTPAFYTRESKTTDNAGNLAIRSMGKAVIPFKTSLNYCDPAAYTEMDITERLSFFTLSEGCLVALGDYSQLGTIKAKDFGKLNDYFVIRSVANYDLPGMQVRAVNGI